MLMVWNFPYQRLKMTWLVCRVEPLSGSAGTLAVSAVPQAGMAASMPSLPADRIRAVPRRSN
ncbi:MAG: hypothetical protein NTV19_09010 [Burkholderiales bacterium]|nr:hypothetical protein [Burkholderiales bacterium]